MRRFWQAAIVCLALIGAAPWAQAKDVLERVGTIRNGQATRVDVVVNSDAELGTYCLLRFAAWGRGKGETWVDLGADQVEQLRNLTSRAAKDNGSWGVNETPIGSILTSEGEIIVSLVSTPGGNTVCWGYRPLESETLQGAMLMTRAQAMQAAQLLSLTMDRLRALRSPS